MTRRGFALLIAVGIVLMVAVIGGVVFAVSTDSVKRMNDDYLRLQAELLAKSAQEYALLRISGVDHDKSNGYCLEKLNIVADPYYEINVTMRYLFTPANTPSGCLVLAQPTTGMENSEGTVLIDVVVTVNTAKAGLDEPISIHRRSLQKP